jgi:hypothetical protein
MNSAMLYAAATFAVITGFAHSILGERRLIAPILRDSQSGSGPEVLKHPMARQILRFAWHITTLSWFAEAAVLILAGTLEPARQGRPIVFVIALSFLAMAAVSLIVSRGRHIGWPFLAATGAAALGALI